MTKCPKCGSTDGWTAKCRAFGWVEQQGAWEDGGDRETYDTLTEGLNWKDTKWVVCNSCGKKILRADMSEPRDERKAGEGA